VLSSSSLMQTSGQTKCVTRRVSHLLVRSISSMRMVSLLVSVYVVDLPARISDTPPTSCSVDLARDCGSGGCVGGSYLFFRRG